jgi:predicted nucleotidyltransferase
MKVFGTDQPPAAMGKKEIIDIIRSSKPEIVARYGVQRLGLFGSYVLEQGFPRAATKSIQVSVFYSS